LLHLSNLKSFPKLKEHFINNATEWQEFLTDLEKEDQEVVLPAPFT
jgi:hypothetical protein